jgi:hypothetical protein
MKQCAAQTKSGNRCKRGALEDCAGYCRQHFDQLPADTAEAKLKRNKAKIFLQKAGGAIKNGLDIYEIGKTIWEIVGPYLSLRERDLLQALASSKDSGERVNLANTLKLSLSKDHKLNS